MILEIFGLYVLAIFALIFYAETGKRKEIGVVGALLLLMLSASVISDGVQMASGQSINTTSTFNGTTNQTITETTETPVYTDIALPFVDFKQLFGLIGFLLAIYMILYYVFAR